MFTVMGEIQVGLIGVLTNLMTLVIMKIARCLEVTRMKVGMMHSVEVNIMQFVHNFQLVLLILHKKFNLT